MPTSTSKYYLYNPITKQKVELDETVIKFYDACAAADSMPGIWEVHVKRDGKAKR